jgi:proteasome lid subunit RPN8/RPN11
MGMELEVTSGTIATLVEEAARAAPAECCGLLLGVPGKVDSVLPAANVAPDPARHFEIDPVALIAAYRAAREGGPHVIGYYHSHPRGHPLPSAIDCEHASGDGRAWAIVTGNDVTFWRDGENGFEELPTRVLPG